MAPSPLSAAVGWMGPALGAVSGFAGEGPASLISLLASLGAEGPGLCLGDLSARCCTHHGGHPELTSSRCPFSLQGRCHFLCPDPPAAEANGRREAHGGPGGTGSLKLITSSGHCDGGDMEIPSALPSAHFPLRYATISLDTAATGNLRGWGRLCPLLTPAARPQRVGHSLLLSPPPDISQSPYFLIVFFNFIFCCRGAGSECC